MPMSRSELINLIGDVIFKINSRLTDLDQGQPDWVTLDDLSDDLVHYQKKLIKVAFETGSEDFIKLTNALEQTKKKIGTTINDVTKTAETINNIAKFVGTVEKIVKLVGVFALLLQPTGR